MSDDRTEGEGPPGGGSPEGAGEGRAGAGPPEGEPGAREALSDRLSIRVPARHNPRLARVVEQINEDEEVHALWVAANVTAMDRLEISDHGPVHMQIVANSALKLLRLLVDAGLQPGIVEDYGLTPKDAEVVVVLAALFHDVGMSIHREDHEAYSLFVAQPKLKEILSGVYDSPHDTVVRSEVLHAVIAHRAGGEPLTLEAGILRVADALDMAEGRSRIPFKQGSTSIHAVSAAAIKGVHIEEGEDTPVRIRVEMTNSAGVFQVDELLRRKLAGSGLEGHVEVAAHVKGETEKRLVERFRL